MTRSHSRKIVLGLAFALSALAPLASAQKKYSGKKSVTKHGNVAISVGSQGVGWHADLGFKSKHGSFGIRWDKPFSKHSYRSYKKHGGYAGYGFPSCCPFVPGHYRTVKEKVWVPGCSRKVWIEPVFEVWTDVCGTLRRRVTAGGHFQIVHDPGYWDTVYNRVWVPGKRKCSAGIHAH